MAYAGLFGAINLAINAIKITGFVWIKVNPDAQALTTPRNDRIDIHIISPVTGMVAMLWQGYMMTIVVVHDGSYLYSKMARYE